MLQTNIIPSLLLLRLLPLIRLLQLLRELTDYPRVSIIVTINPPALHQRAASSVGCQIPHWSAIPFFLSVEDVSTSETDRRHLYPRQKKNEWKWIFSQDVKGELRRGHIIFTLWNMNEVSSYWHFSTCMFSIYHQWGSGEFNISPRSIALNVLFSCSMTLSLKVDRILSHLPYQASLISSHFLWRTIFHLDFLLSVLN